MFEAFLVVTVVALVIVSLCLAIAVVKKTPVPGTQQQTTQPVVTQAAPTAAAAAQSAQAAASSTAANPQRRRISIWLILLFHLVFGAIVGLITYFAATHKLAATATTTTDKPTAPSSGDLTWVIVKNVWNGFAGICGVIWDWAWNTANEHSLWIVAVLAVTVFMIILWKSKDFRKWLGTFILFAVGGSVICFGVYKGHQALTIAAEAKLGLPAPKPGEVVKDLTVFTDEIVECSWAFDPRHYNVEMTFGKSAAGMDYWQQNSKPGDSDTPDGIVTSVGKEVPAMRPSPSKVWLRMRVPKGTPKGEKLDEVVRITQRKVP